MNNRALTSIIPYMPSAIIRHEVSERIVPPVTDIYETADSFVVKLDMPGATKESIRLQIEPRKLVVQCSIGVADEKNLVYSEIGRKRYYREFNITDGIAYDKVSAQFELGVLTITLPKTEEVKAHEIKIQ